MKKSQKELIRHPFYIVMFIVLAVYVVSLLALLGWGLLTSIRSYYNFDMNGPFRLPEDLKNLSNYVTVWTELKLPVVTDKGIEEVDMLIMFWNSFLYAGGSTVTAVFFPLFTAYAAAKFKKYAFCRSLYTVCIVIMIIPIVGSLPSELKVINALGIYDNMFWMWIMKGGVFGTNFLVFYANYVGLPEGYAEAARIDGASEFDIFNKIMLPLSVGTILAMGLLSFIGFWKDYQTPLIYLPSYPTAAYALFAFQFKYTAASASLPIRIASCMTVTVPIAVLYVSLNKTFTKNMAIGGLKG